MKAYCRLKSAFSCLDYVQNVYDSQVVLKCIAIRSSSIQRAEQCGANAAGRLLWCRSAGFQLGTSHIITLIKRPVQRVETQKERRRAFRRGQLAGTRYPRQAIRGTGLGRGDPSADGASGTSGTYVEEVPIACLV